MNVAIARTTPRVFLPKLLGNWGWALGMLTLNVAMETTGKQGQKSILTQKDFFHARQINRKTASGTMV